MVMSVSELGWPPHAAPRSLHPLSLDDRVVRAVEDNHVAGAYVLAEAPSSTLRRLQRVGGGQPVVTGIKCIRRQSVALRSDPQDRGSALVQRAESLRRSDPAR